MVMFRIGRGCCADLTIDWILCHLAFEPADHWYLARLILWMTRRQWIFLDTEEWFVMILRAVGKVLDEGKIR